MKKILAAAVCFCLLMFSGCNNATGPDTDNEGNTSGGNNAGANMQHFLENYTAYTDTPFGIKIYYPNGWSKNITDEYIIFKSPSDNVQMNYAYTKVDERISAEKYAQLAVEELKSRVNGFNLESMESVPIKNYDTVALSYSSDGINSTNYTIQYILTKDSKVCISMLSDIKPISDRHKEIMLTCLEQIVIY